MATGNFSEFQSAYRVRHSTALLKVVNNIVRTTCDQKTTALLALDISAAFDSIDLHILLERCRKDFNVNGIALNWPTSFITCRTQHIKAARSASVSCLSGVPQGSVVLGPLLFAMYISPISNIVIAHRLRYQQYADYTQQYMAMRPSDGSTFDALSRCVDDEYRWFLENGMMLNPSKTEAILFGTRVQRAKVDTIPSHFIDIRDNIKKSPVKRWQRDVI